MDLLTKTYQYIVFHSPPRLQLSLGKESAIHLFVISLQPRKGTVRAFISRVWTQPTVEEVPHFFLSFLTYMLRSSVPHPINLEESVSATYPR